jgi:hypothetical protein
LLLLSGTGVVGVVGCGVSGGAVGSVFRLAGLELVRELGIDGNMSDAAIDDSSLGLVSVEVARNQPVGSHQLDFTSVADVRLTTRQNTRPILKWKGTCISGSCNQILDN